MNRPVKLFMLSESEGESYRKDLLNIMCKSNFDWTTLYDDGKLIEEDIEFESKINAKEILKSPKLMEELLKKNFPNISQLRGFQKKALDELILKENNVFLKNYTGSGKSLLFQLYALLHPGMTIVVSPFVAITLGKSLEFLTLRSNLKIPFQSPDSCYQFLVILPTKGSFFESHCPIFSKTAVYYSRTVHLLLYPLFPGTPFYSENQYDLH